MLGADDLGWRGRAIALAALGGAELARAAFAQAERDSPSPLEMQLLVYLALSDAQMSGPAEDDPGISLSLGLESYDELVDGLLLRGLVRLLPIADWEADDDEEDEEDEEDEHEDDLPMEPHLTDQGMREVELWLTRVARLFRGWPPDRPDVDDAIG